jgi:hypothetical protein
MAGEIVIKWFKYLPVFKRTLSLSFAFRRASPQTTVPAPLPQDVELSD